MKFFNVKIRQTVEVPDNSVRVITMKNGRKAAQAEIGGVKMFKFLSMDEAAKLEK